MIIQVGFTPANRRQVLSFNPDSGFQPCRRLLMVRGYYSWQDFSANRFQPVGGYGWLLKSAGSTITPPTDVRVFNR
jgi:hypothetical protein